MNKTKIFFAGLIVIFAGLFLSYNSADAATCTKTWNGKSYSYNYGPTGSTGTFTFTNWANTQYNISISVIGKTTVCLNQTDFNSMMSWLYNSDASAFWATGYSSWSRNLSCGNTHSYSKTQTPVNGVCGTADGATYTTAPVSGLCSAGNASSVTVNTSTFTWSCSGINGGVTDQCSADKGSNGQSGTSTSGVGGGGGGGQQSSVMTAVECVVSNTLPNTEETITYSASPVGGGPNYDYTWSNGATGTGASVDVTKSLPSVVTPSVTVTDQGVSILKVCPPAEFAYRPDIRVVPPITAGTCKLTWNTDKLPVGATCKVYADGVEKLNVNSDSQVDPGAKYQVRCTYTPEGGSSTTTVSEIKACVKNPSLIEI